MTTNLVTKNFKEHLTDQFIESFTEPANNSYYMFVSKHTEFENGDTPVVPVDNVKTIRSDLFKEMIFGKKITSNDVMPMIRRYNWTSNTVYDIYRDDVDLFSKQFYVVVDNGAQYFVYKVLNNNNGAPSTISPISETDESACNFVTSDGYVWKLMYKLNEATFEKFATLDYMPVATSSNVAGNTVKGAIDVILVSNNGSDYVSTFTGQFAADDLRTAIPGGQGNSTTYRLGTSASTETNFYAGCALYISSGTGAGQLKSILAYNPSNRVLVVNSIFSTPPDSSSAYEIFPNVIIEGDGSGAQAFARIGSNATVSGFISNVEITSRGNNYTYATATVVGNTAGQSNLAILKVVIPPEGGHGSDAPAELGSSYLGVSVTLSNTEGGYLTTNNDFRTFGIIKDVLYNNVTFGVEEISGAFSNSENIYQVNYKTLTGNASVSSSNSTITGTFTEFDKALAQGSKVIIFDTVLDQQCLRTVTGIANGTSFTIDSNCSFTSSISRIAVVDILASCVKSGNTLPFITVTNTEPKFTTGKFLIGESSGAMAKVANIVFNDKAFNNWSYFDNRTKINYSGITGTPVQDAVVFQEFIELSNAYLHSYDPSYVYLTYEKGPINASPEQLLQANDGSFSFTLTSTKYEPDIVDGAGKVLYIENTDPITRSNTQSETFRIILDF